MAGNKKLFPLFIIIEKVILIPLLISYFHLTTLFFNKIIFFKVSVKLKRSCENIMTHFVIFKEDTQISVACESQET